MCWDSAEKMWRLCYPPQGRGAGSGHQPSNSEALICPRLAGTTFYLALTKEGDLWDSLRESRLFVRRCQLSRYVLSWPLCLIPVRSHQFLAYQYSQLLQDFPENHWPILLFLELSAFAFGLGRNQGSHGSLRYLMLFLSQWRGGQVHLKGARCEPYWSLALYAKPFSCFYLRPYFSHRVANAVVFHLCSFIGSSKVLPLSAENPVNFRLGLTGTMWSPRKASASKSCFISLLFIRYGVSKKRASRHLIIQRTVQKVPGRSAKPLSSFYLRNERSLALSFSFSCFP